MGAWKRRIFGWCCSCSCVSPPVLLVSAVLLQLFASAAAAPPPLGPAAP
jgi:hypothetical protein